MRLTSQLPKLLSLLTDIQLDTPTTMTLLEEIYLQPLRVGHMSPFLHYTLI